MKHMHGRARTYTIAHTRTHTLTHARTRVHARALGFTRSRTQARMCASRTCTQARRCTCRGTRTRTRTRTRTHLTSPHLTSPHLTPLHARTHRFSGAGCNRREPCRHGVGSRRLRSQPAPARSPTVGCGHVRKALSRRSPWSAARICSFPKTGPPPTRQTCMTRPSTR